MINFEILGRVTAWQDDWVANLSRQQQLLLAVLVLAKGTLVPGIDLERALCWDEKDRPPIGGLKRVAHDLRLELRQGSAGDGPLPGGDGAYRLPFDAQQADVWRFRAKVNEARLATGQESVRHMRQALSEWGADAAGLYGGYPLAGLPGIWADSSRAALRTEYRDAIYHCLKQGMDEGSYDLAMRECDQLATDQEALLDEPFVELWMLATYWAGQRTRAGQIFRRAADSTAHHLGSPLSARLRRLAELIRDEDPRLGGPDEIPALASSHSIPTTTRRRPMSDPQTVFHNSGHAKVGGQINHNTGSVIINMGADSDPAEETEKAEEADDADRHGS